MSGPRRIPYGTVAVLPSHLEHGRPAAYNAYKCRCERCVYWRNSYDRERYALLKRRREESR